MLFCYFFIAEDDCDLLYDLRGEPDCCLLPRCSSTQPTVQLLINQSLPQMRNQYTSEMSGNPRPVFVYPGTIAVFEVRLVRYTCKCQMDAKYVESLYDPNNSLCGPILLLRLITKKINKWYQSPLADNPEQHSK